MKMGKLSSLTNRYLIPLDVNAYEQDTTSSRVLDTWLIDGQSGKELSFTPQLNMTSFWLGDVKTSSSVISENGSYEIASSLHYSGNGVLNTSQLRFSVDWNETNPTVFDLAYIEGRGSCQPVSNVSSCLPHGHPLLILFPLDLRLGVLLHPTFRHGSPSIHVVLGNFSHLVDRASQAPG